MTSTARLRRAAVAERLLSGSPQAVASLDWDALDRAPAWLALTDAEFTTFQCRVGAVLCGHALRLWIDRARLAAAQAALGAPFLRALLAERGSASIPTDLFACPEIDSPADVEPAKAIAELEQAHDTLGSSMQRDIAAGRAPELDAIAGSVLRAAARHRMRCATIERLAGMIAVRAGIAPVAAA